MPARPNTISNPNQLFAWIRTSLTDSGKLQLGRSTPLTVASDLAVDATYDANESTVISNTRTRVNEIEAALIAAGILTA